ncbi:MAG TPA: mannose-1-phosphate guanylyltransferase, partial [Sphingobacteriaceae bacterium]|nr:mannose-1-phosphate guanylyltransferase [Sphingobacteriaceae bacterium]
MKNNYAVIMAGGIGSRFWPMSRTNYPKQFIDIFGTGRTLIQSTYDRFKNIVPEENIFIVTNINYFDIIKEQLPDINDNQILAEPIMRNTAPCIAYASYKINALNPNANIVVSPSDHLIINADEFSDCIIKALDACSQHDCLFTLGVMPTRPDTGYGYIQYTNDTLDGGFQKVKTFTEKPNEDLAKTFIQSGDFLWNSGIFIWSSKAILNSLNKYVPELSDTFNNGKLNYNTDTEKDFIAMAYERSPSISIDFAIMEKADNVYVLPVQFGWSDLGTWGSVHDLAEKDTNGNFYKADSKVMLYDSTNCLVKVLPEKLVVLKGLNDYVVVESDNALLIFPRKDEQNLKQVLADVKTKY